MRYFWITIFFLISSLANAQVPNELIRLRSQGFLNVVPVLTHDSTGGTADQSHGQCKIFLGRTKDGMWAGSLAFLAGDEEAPAEQDPTLAKELTLWALLHENAHCLWYSRGGPVNFIVPEYSKSRNETLASVLLSHRSMSEVVLSESFADIYSAMLFKKTFPKSTLLNKIAAARDKASAKKYDSLFEVNIAGDAIRLVEKSSLPSVNFPKKWFERASKMASHDMLVDLVSRSPRVQEELLSEAYFKSLVSQWWEGFAEDRECWWKGRYFDVAVLLYEKIGCLPPVPYTANAIAIDKKLRVWFMGEDQQKKRALVTEWLKP